jgi:hypothetical protein
MFDIARLTSISDVFDGRREAAPERRRQEEWRERH